MKPFKLVALLVLVTLGATGCGRYLTPAAAIVDGKIITMSELDARVRSQAPKSGGPAAKPTLDAERRELAQMIQDRIVRSEAEKRHLSASTQQIDARFQQIRNRFPSEAAFQNALSQQGVDPTTVKDRIGLRLIVEQIQASLASKVTVADADIKTAYGDGSSFQQARVRHILFAARSPADFPKALKKAQAAYIALAKGADFAKLAKQLSDDPGSKAQGGELGFITHGRTVPEFDKAAFSLKPRQISRPVRTQFGYHIIQAEQIVAKTLAQATPELRKQLQDKAAKKVFDDFLSERINKAQIQVNPLLGTFDPATLTIVDRKFYKPAAPPAQPQGLPGLGIGNGAPIPSQP